FASDSQSLVVNQKTHFQFFSLPDINEGKRIEAPKDKPFDASSMTLSADGRYLVLRRDTGHVRVFDLTTDTEILALEETGGLFFTPDSQRLVTISRDYRSKRPIRMHEIATGKLVYEAPQ